MTRTVKRYQISDGLDIDGLKLDSLLAEIARDHNQMPLEALKTRWVRSQMVMGWQPASTTTQAGSQTPPTQAPFMNAINSPGEVVGETTDSVTGGVVNLERLKAAVVPGLRTINAPEELYRDTQYLATWLLRFESPAVLEGLDVYFLTDQATSIPSWRQRYNNNFRYGSPAPEGFSANQSTQDVVIAVTVDCPYMPIRQAQCSVILTKSGFRTRSFRLFNETTALSTAEYPDGFPNYDSYGALDGGRPNGIAVSEHQHRLSIPARSVVRVHLAIPKYDGTVISTAPWGNYPSNTFKPSVTATFLEPLRSLR